MTNHTYGCVSFMSGIGFGTRGFHRARALLAGHEARFGEALGIDIDARACRQFERITGGRAMVGDFHSLQPADIRAFVGDRAPLLVMSSPPCKPFSQLLSKAKAAEPEYVRMAQLYLKALNLAVETWDDPPAVIAFENVRGILSRGAAILTQAIELCRARGYAVDHRVFDCAEVGGLGARRPRHILIARHLGKMRQVISLPPLQRVKTCGEVISQLPLPNDPSAGPLHRLPQLELITHLRLAFVEAGKDHRSIPRAVEPWSRGLLRAPVAPGQHPHDVQGRHFVNHPNEPARTVAGSGSNGNGCVADPRLADLAHPDGAFKHCMRVAPINETAGTITASPSPSSGRLAVADPRPWHHGALGVEEPSAPAHCVTSGGSPSTGFRSIADDRVAQLPLLDRPGRHTNKYHVAAPDRPARTITGTDGRVGSGAPCIADDRVQQVLLGHEARRDTYGVVDAGAPAGTVRGRADVRTGSAAVADPRVAQLPIAGSERADHWSGKPGLLGVNDWERPAQTVTAKTTVTGSNAPGAVADPRVQSIPLGCDAHNGSYGVQRSDQVANTVTGTGDLHNGTLGCAAPMPTPPIHAEYLFLTVDEALDMLARGEKIPKGRIPVIPSPWDGWWHRPMTDLELALLQSHPARFENGAPFDLGDATREEARMWIGNAIPCDSATAWGNEILLGALREELGVFALTASGTWVEPHQESR